MILYLVKSVVLVVVIVAVVAVTFIYADVSFSVTLYM